MKTDVLIVGAGPTGLALAIALEKSGIDFRIIDKAPGPGTASRALRSRPARWNSTISLDLAMKSWRQA